MKRVLFSFAVLAATAVMVSCGNKSGQNAEGQDSAAVVGEQTEQTAVAAADPLQEKYPKLSFEPLKVDGKYFSMTVYAEKGKCGIETSWNKDETMSLMLMTFNEKGVKQRNFPLRVDVEKGSVDEVKKKSHTFTLENIKEDKGEVEINGQKMWCFVGDIGNTFFIANSTAEPDRVVILRAATYAYEQSEEIKKSFDTFKIK